MLVKRAFALVVLLGVVTAVLFAVPSDHYLFLPDRARPVDPLVAVPDEPDQAGAEDEDGGVYMVDILVRKASLAERLFPGLADGASLVPGHAVNPVGVPETERRQSSLNEMSRSQQIAVTVALRSLGYDVEVREQGLEIDTVVPGKPADGKLQVGDVLLRADGDPARTREDLLDAMEDIRPGEEVEVTVLRDGKRVRLQLGTEPAEDDPDRAVFGVIVVQAADFDFPVDVEIDAGDIGGPSAGLAFALDVVDELGEDVDSGRTVVATGELTLEGDVLPIGGIKQKVIGARRAGADVFLVPDRNAADARAAADGLEIVAVSDFDEALSALAAA